jgi:hypothetical protein
MTRRIWVALMTVVAIAVGSVVLWAGQENRPGMPTIARMFVLNKERTEAVPVTVVSNEVMPVSVVGTPVVAFVPNATVSSVSRQARQNWEYLQIPLRLGADPVPAINTAGQDGWEAVAVLPAAGANTASLLLKRPR